MHKSGLVDKKEGGGYVALPLHCEWGQGGGVVKVLVVGEET